MIKVLLPFCIVAVTFLGACHADAPKDDVTAAPTSFPSSTVPTDTPKSVLNDTSNATTVTINPQPLPSATVQPKATRSAALNPEHGQPGHRCDIAVGAPLNSPAQPVQQTPGATQTLPAQPLPAQPMPAQTKPATTPTGTVKLNPAHGQPGHDCAIPVGQPLKG